jgi:exosortase
MKRYTNLGFAALLAASIALGWRPLMATLHLALTNDAYTHILLIAPLSVALIYIARNELRASTEGKLAAVAGLVGALAVAAFARWGMSSPPPGLALTLAMFALVLWWIASVGYCFGGTAFRELLFPLGFLFWMVPLPEFALDRVVQFLQAGSAFSARVLFWLARIPVTQDGLVLSIPGLDVEVAPECSSIRSSLFLVVTTMLLAHLFLRSRWRQVLLVALSIPLSIAKNGLRIFVIAALSTRVDSSYLDGNLHHHGGIVFFAVAVVVVVGLLWFLVRSESAGHEQPVAH